MIVSLGDRRRRRGMGDAADDPAYQAERQAYASKWQQVIQSPEQAKAALGFIAEELHRAYDAIKASSADFGTREEMRQLLDQTNRYAQDLYSMVEEYDTNGLNFSDAAPQVGAMIGQLYFDTDRQLQLASKIADFYDSGWADAFWNAVSQLPHMGQQAILDIVDTGHKALNKAIGWPEWVAPTLVAVGVAGVGFWAYLTFLKPAGAGGVLASLLRKARA